MNGRNIESLRSILKRTEPGDPLRRLIMKVALREQKSANHMANSAPPSAPASNRLNRKRFKKRKIADAARRILGSSRLPIEKNVLAVRYVPHVVLDNLLPERQKHWKPILRRDRHSPATRARIERLSFLDAPEETLQCLSGVIGIEGSALKATIDFDFEYVDDIGPFLLMAEFWPFLAPVFTGGGKMHPPVQKVIAAVGLSHSLGMTFPHLRSLRDVWAMPVQRRRPAGRSTSSARYLEPQTAEIAADRLVDEINVWLGAAGTNTELTNLGRANLKSLVTEMLDNAERHSSYQDRDGSWSLAAFMAKRTVQGEPRYACHIAILSVGSTICESLDATAPDELREMIDAFVERMRRAGAKQHRDTLVTLAAIQDGVTRDETAYMAGSGGYGFMHFVDSVNLLGLSKRDQFAPKIAILSGKSCIRLQTPYIKGIRRDGEAARKLLFNPSNSMGEPADEAFVYDLPLHLPGTVISVGFTLDPDFYRTIFDDDDDLAG